MELDKLKKLQMVQLSIMKDIHRVCVEHQLNYYLMYGSALGAVRHKGFIPWDVDIDIAMPRKDYDSFVNHLSKELNPRLKCVSYKTEKKYTSPHALVLMKDTEIIDKTGTRQTDLRPSEIFVDVFPLDVCPESKKQQEKQARLLVFIKSLKFRKASWIFPGNGFIIRMFKYIIRLLFVPITWRMLNSWEERVMTKYNDKSKSGLWCSMAGLTPSAGYMNNVTPVGFYGTPVLTPFEDTFLYIPQNVDYILNNRYGDFKQIPSIEEQQAQIDMFVDAKW